MEVSVDSYGWMWMSLLTPVAFPSSQPHMAAEIFFEVHGHGSSVDCVGDPGLPFHMNNQWCERSSGDAKEKADDSSQFVVKMTDCSHLPMSLRLVPSLTGLNPGTPTLSALGT